MNTFIVSLFFTVGISTWIYTKMQRKSGNNTEQTLIAVAITGAIIFLISYTLFGLVL